MSNYNNSVRYRRPSINDHPGPRFTTPINRSILQNNIIEIQPKRTNPQQPSNKPTTETNTFTASTNRNNSNDTQPKPNNTQQQPPPNKPTTETNTFPIPTNLDIPQNNTQSKPNNPQQQPPNKPTTETNTSTSILLKTSNPSSIQNKTTIPEQKTNSIDSSKQTTPINNLPKISTTNNVEERRIDYNEQKRPSLNQQSTNSTPQKNPQGGRSRLFIGNIPSDLTQEEFQSLLGKYGELVEYYVNPSRGFGFVKFNSKIFAEQAKNDLDGYLLRGKQLRIRFASQGALVKVKNLSANVSNELLKEAFEQYFGDVERAVILVDDRGRSIGEGIVEFERKPSAQKCLNDCTERCFFLTKDLKPINVEPWDMKDEDDGLPEKLLIHNDVYLKERALKPYFAEPNTIQYNIGMKWKQLELQEKELLEEVKKRMQIASEQLQVEINQMLLEHEAQVLRVELKRRQEELRRIDEIRSQEIDRRRNIMPMHRPDAYNTSVGNAFHQNQAAYATSINNVYHQNQAAPAAYPQSTPLMQQPNPMEFPYTINQTSHGYNVQKRPNVRPLDVDYNQHLQIQGFDQKRPRY